MHESQPTSPWPSLSGPRTLIAALAREYSVELLQELHARGWSSASEMARDMGIHVATAMRKLAELEGLGLLEKRNRAASDVVEYALRRPRVEIILDFAAAAKVSSKDAWGQAEKLVVKERPNRKILMESDEKAGRVRRILFLKFMRRKTEARSMELTEIEGGFLFHLPFASEAGRSVAEICRESRISNPIHVARILEFVREMERVGVVDLIR